MSITSAGVGSGLDLESLIQASVEAEGTPRIASIERRESAVSLQITAIGQIKSDLSAFNSTLDSLKELSTFQGRTAQVTQPTEGDVISVSASDKATAGSFDIKVTQLAQGSRAVQNDANALSSPSDVVTASGGTLTFTAGTESFSVTLAAGATLTDLRTAINESSSSFGLSANIINTGGASPLSKLVLTSEVTGTGNDLSITADTAELDSVSTTAFGGGAGGMAISLQDQAQDATLEIDGIVTTSSTNTFANAIQDITIEALRVDTVNSARLEVATDKDAVRESIGQFVDGFNAVLNTLDTVITSRTADATARGLRNALINQLGSSVAGAGNFQTLFDIGIEMGERNRLSIRSTGPNTLDDAFSNFDDIGTLFAGSGGVANILSDTADLYLQAGGLIQIQENSLERQEQSLEKERSDLAFRMERFEARLRDRFASLDVLIAGLRAQGSAVTSALANLPGFTRNES